MKSKHTKGNFSIKKNQFGRTELWVDGDIEDTLSEDCNTAEMVKDEVKCGFCVNHKK